MTAHLTTCLVNCEDTGKKMTADILQRSDKSLKVVIQGTNITINMNRTDTRKSYIGRSAGLEFSTMG